MIESESDAFSAMVELAELLEDLLDGRRVIEAYLKDPGVAVAAEELFKRLGH